MSSIGRTWVTIFRTTLTTNSTSHAKLIYYAARLITSFVFLTNATSSSNYVYLKITAPVCLAVSRGTFLTFALNVCALLGVRGAGEFGICLSTHAVRCCQLYAASYLYWILFPPDL
jgi:hypothetical protein